MKLFVVNDGSTSSVISHIMQVDGQHLVGSIQEAEAVFADSVMFPAEDFKADVVNTSVGARGLFLDRKSQKLLYESLNLDPGKVTKSVIYGLTCKGKMSDLIEISLTNRLMNDNCGPLVGMATAVAIKLDAATLADAIPQYTAIKKLFADIEYSGEFAIGIAEDFSATEFHLGHSQNLYPIFAEICKHKIVEQVEFMLGKMEICELYEAISVACLVSHHPYPLPVAIATPVMRVPQTAEKHLWRMPWGTNEFAIVTTHGRVMKEARIRLYRTISNITQLAPLVQFRTDLGWTLPMNISVPSNTKATSNVSFVLSQDKFEKLQDFVPQAPTQ